MFSILERNGENRKVKMSLFNNLLTELTVYLLKFNFNILNFKNVFLF